MLAIDILLLIGAALLAIGAAALGGAALDRRTQARQRQKLGARNALAVSAQVAECCAACGTATDATIDVWDAGQWWHQACYRNVLQGE